MTALARWRLQTLRTAAGGAPTDDAVYVVTAYAGNPGEYQLPVCERHKVETVALVWVEFRVAVLRGR